MTCLINFLNKSVPLRLLPGLLLGGLLLTGCAGAGSSPASQRQDSAPQVRSVTAEKSSPRMAGSGEIRWLAEAVASSGEEVLTFELKDGSGQIERVQQGSAAVWSWFPETPGVYQVRVIATAATGRRSEGAWSEPYLIAPPLRVARPQPGKSAPQAAQTEPIAWMIEATGGIAPLSYELELEQDGRIKWKIFTWATPGWAWKPVEAGEYRLRASVSDARGNRVQSAWSAPYEIAPPLTLTQPVAGVIGPQVIDMKLIPWTVEATGGVGETTLEFELSRAGAEQSKVWTEASLPWVWRPEEPGEYRVRAIMTDSLGNQLTGDWSAPYRIEPPLAIERLSSDRPAPQAARAGGINWAVAASGGVGAKTYAFELSRNQETGVLIEQGFDPTWQWTPAMEGHYRVRAIVTDALDNRVMSNWSTAYEIFPPLEVARPEPDNRANQYMIHSQVSWNVQASGGVGEKNYSYILEGKTGETETLQTGSSSACTWRPETIGFYRVRVLVTDGLGNQQESSRSHWKEIRGPLELIALAPSRPSPQPALQEPIYWNAETSGGVGTLTYEFLSIMSGVESIEQTGSSPALRWSPRKAGLYRLKVRVWDEAGHSIESDWSTEYSITPAVTTETLIAFFPVENLANVKAPYRQIGGLYRELLSSEIPLLPADRLEQFMRIHRMRYTGGINSTLAKALREENGVGAVVITNLETWREQGSPRVSLFSRLVTTGGEPEIVWMDSVGLSGDDSPGLLGVGLVNNVQELLEKALTQLLDSFRAYLAGHSPSYRHAAAQQGPSLINGRTGTADGSIGPVKKRHLPQFFYRASSFDPAGQYRVAVIPFLNINARKHAGGIVALHILKQLHRYGNIRVLEPGLVRETLLRYRMIMQSGPSLAASDVLTDAKILGADIVVSGRAFDYQGDIGVSKVDFSMLAFDGEKREVLWASRSYAVGDSGVYFFDWGRVSTAHGLASRMTQAVVKLLEE